MTDLNITLKQLSALSHETRLKAFKMLMEAGPDGVQAGQISDLLNVAPNSLSAHLSVLSKSGLVTVERQGRNMVYRPNIPAVNSMLSSLVENCCNGHPEVCGPLAELQSVAC